MQELGLAHGASPFFKGCADLVSQGLARKNSCFFKLFFLPGPLRMYLQGCNTYHQEDFIMYTMEQLSQITGLTTRTLRNY